ncbi:outer membrane import complex 1 [Hyphodiscus hymeniophilus]|uniref:Outer membrane import complex 1 n=1 Tax=Hyphodiscus hymeniophilus TaxID=353542 RepID=A0A9P6VCD8_9HELO|nr:outer membrane import complex 1 [Hyphodiscus hymeniophilus]
MPLELHVWGPAFSLPSIDAHCLAAIAYLQQAVPRGEWQLIASSDPALIRILPLHVFTINPVADELPALRNGDIWIGGFRNIFHYIAQYSAGEWVLDAGLPEQESADCIASLPRFSSFIESHGQPLLDLSLYVSSQNYIEITRPIYNTIQPFPLPYLTPPSVRAAAKARTAHLGLSSLDIDTDDTTQSSKDSVIPQSLRRPRNTVSSLLASSPEANAQIRLDALATDFFEPLQKLRRGKRFLVSDEQISSLDCLALGYLSLMLIPELPQPWLVKTMRKKFPDLCSWTNEWRREVFGPDIRAEDALSPKEKARSHLPWKAPANNDAMGIGGMFLSSIADSIPIFGQLRRNTRMQQHGGKTPEEDHSSSWHTFGILGGILAGVGLVAGYMFHQGMISLPGPEEPEKQRGGLGDLGEAGDMLSMYANRKGNEWVTGRSNSGGRGRTGWCEE